MKQAVLYIQTNFVLIKNGGISFYIETVILGLFYVIKAEI